ncbi:MAG: response regulator, partial [Myxococcota bacterium]
YELCTKVKSDAATRDIPVILLTQLSDPYDIIRGLQAGADNFIIKPYDQDNLLLRVEHLLENLELRRMGRAETAIEIFFKGGKYQINSERRQILDLLLSVFDEALEKNRELLKSREKLQEINEQLEKGVTEREKLIDELTGALAKVKTLSGLIPICASCKKIRNDKGYWLGVEEFVRENSDATFSHSLCNACLERLYPEDVEENRKKS